MNGRLRLSVLILCCLGFGAQGATQHIRETYRKVNPSVVIIHTQQKIPFPISEGGLTNLPGFGSGVLISADGKVLTAAHVVQSADRVCIEFSDGQLIPARVVGANLSADVALVQLERVPSNVVISKLGDSNEVDVGDEIFIIGAPYGLGHSLTVGHVSARHAPNTILNSKSAAELIQTDAAINSGNSGSPMFNVNGEVIGIVTNILSRSGGSEGLGFAVTSSTARQVLLEHKSFWFGLDGVLIEGDLAKTLNLPQPAGLLVQHVAEGSPAWQAGVRAGALPTSIDGEDLLLGGDILLEVNGVAIMESDGLLEQIYTSLNKLKAGEKLKSKVLRDGRVVELSTLITSQ